MMLLGKVSWLLCTLGGVKQCRICSLGYLAAEVEIYIFFFFFGLLVLTGIKKMLKD